MARMLSEQEMQNVMAYGYCRVCGSPREVVTTETFEPTGDVNERGWPMFDETITRTYSELRCPLGHAQDGHLHD